MLKKVYFFIAFPPAPKIVINRVASDTLEITWDKFQSDGIYYKLQVKQGDKVVFSDDKITKVPYELKGLQEGKTYVANLWICAKSKCTMSTEPTQMKTVGPSPEGKTKLCLDLSKKHASNTPFPNYDPVSSKSLKNNAITRLRGKLIQFRTKFRPCVIVGGYRSVSRKWSIASFVVFRVFSDTAVESPP